LTARSIPESSRAIKQNGTGAALTVVTVFLGTGKSETLAQCVQKRGSGIDDMLMRPPFTWRVICISMIHVFL